MSFQNAKLICSDANPADYHKQTTERGSPEWIVSAGMLREFARCPSRWKAGYESPDSDAMRWGSLLDCLALTPHQFADRYFLRPENYTATVLRCPTCGSVTEAAKCSKCKVERVKATVEKPWSSNSETCRAIIQAQLDSGKEIVTESELANAREAVGRLRSDKTIAAFIDASLTQVWCTAEWHDDDTGIVVPCRILIDLLPRASSEFGKCIADLKTTRNAGVMPWQRWCHQAGYHIQAAFYNDVYVAATNEDRCQFCFIVQENFQPYEPAKRMLDDEFLTLGRNEYTEALKAYCACLKSGKWPSYDDHDESIQGWTLVRPEPWMVSHAAFAPKFIAAPDEEQEQMINDLVP